MPYLMDTCLLCAPVYPLPPVSRGSLGKASVSKSHRRGIFPICLGQRVVPLRFIMKSLTNSLDAGQKATDV